MSDSLEKLSVAEAEALQKLKEIRQKKKAIERANNDAKKMALGAGIMKAIKAGDLSWNELKPVLQKFVKSKRDRELLGLSDLPPSPPK